ncbi:MAG TPA: nitroreductase family protein [Ruminiclostridium sp.]
MENSFYELATKRRSIRKYTSKPVLREDIEYFISCATNAPSGCDSQCWHFVAVENKELIEKIADGVGKYSKAFYSNGYSGSTDAFLVSREKAPSFFRNAPLVIFVFLDRLDYYDERVTQAFSEKGYSHREMLDKLAYPDILSVGAAIQNLLLAITEKGYGACWMNDPVIAEETIKSLLSVREDLRLISVIPIGEPRYLPQEKKLKDQSSILEYK